MAQRDLHLAIPDPGAQCCPSVYEVDGVFVMLFSQVIRIVNERDLSMMSDAVGPQISLQDFWT
jgi:arginine metabolism regulation protein II